MVKIPYYKQTEDPTKHIIENSKKLGSDVEIKEISLQFLNKVSKYYYSYNFKWFGRPIIQFPQDIIAMQEIIWEVKPDLIIETGVAHGGSIIFYASMLELLDNDGLVIGIDINIKDENKRKITKHPMFRRIKMIEGSSISNEVIEQVSREVNKKERSLVVLDSNHTHDHVLKELELYSKFVKQGSYLVVFDTIVEDMPNDFVSNRPWGIGNNPKTAVWEFLKSNDRFVIDKEIENKLLISVAPDGYLKCIKDEI